MNLAIGYLPDLKGSDLFQQALFTHYFVCLVRADHPVQGRRQQVFNTECRRRRARF